MAVGASRWQIVRQLLVESVLLASVAGVVGLALSLLGVRLFRQSVEGTGPPYWLQFEMDVRSFAVFAAVCLTTALVFGLAPALHTSNLNVNETLNESGRGGGGTMRARRWAGVLVVSQLALALVLLTGAGLMMRTFLAQVRQDVGIDTAGLLRMRFDLTEQNYPSREQRAVFFQQLDDRLASTPGLTATLASTSPQGGGGVRDITIEGRPEPQGAPRPSVTFMVVGGRYFDTLGVRMLRGRALTATDRGDVETPAVVNQRFVAQHFPAEDPIGRRVRIWHPPGQLSGPEWAGGPPEWATIVGVAPNIRQRDPADQQLDAFDPILYVPFASNPQTFTTVLVRSTADASVAAAQLREVIGALDPDLPLFDVETVDQALAENRWPIRVFGSMFAIFAVVAMVLAVVGLYGVTAYSVSQRTREIGVRVALGAQAQQVWWLVTRRASIQIGIGLVLGLGGAIAAGRVLQGSLIRVSGTDPVTLAAVPAMLVLVGLGASLIPARRAMQLDPVAALRHE
jgi:predicted permease